MSKSDEGAPSAHDAPLMIEGPKALTEGVGPIIDLEPLSGLSNEEKIDPQFSAEAPAAEESTETPDAAAYSRWTLPSYAPLAAGLLQPYRADSKLKVNQRTQLDRLYQKVLDDLEELVDAVGLKAA